MQKKRQKFDIDEALDTVDLTFANYSPSAESFEFFNLIRIFFGEDFEVPNPKFHYFIVDMLYGNVKQEDFPYSQLVIDTIRINPNRIGIISSRGTAKSTIATLFYPIIAAVKGSTPVTGPLSHILILSDSQQGGARDQSVLIGNLFKRSAFANEWFESIRSTEKELEVVRTGSEPIEKRHMLIRFKGAQAQPLDHMLFTDDGRVSVGDVAIGDEIFGADGKLCKVVDKSEVFDKPLYELQLKDGRTIQVTGDHINSVVVENSRLNITTKDLLELPLLKGGIPNVWIEACEPMEYSRKEYPIESYKNYLTEEAGNHALADSLLTECIEVKQEVVDYALGYTGNVCKKDLLASLVRSLGGTALVSSDHTYYNLDSEATSIVAITQVPAVPSQCIAVDNEERQYLVQEYVRTHNTGGIRSGSRNPVTGDRYGIIIADDVIKNEAEAYSDTIMHNVTTALNSDALNAMRAKNTQLVLINTPFHKRDPIYMLVESGGFTPLITPVCKQIYDGMPEEEFIGVWPDMHNYDSVMERYQNAISSNGTKAFNQELMLRVSNEEDRMVTDGMIQWYDRNLILKMIDGYSLYITTDFTTTSTAKSDFSNLIVWAVSSNNDYFMLDLCLRRQELQEQYNELFKMISVWSKGGKPIDVGIEIDGQQKAHLFALKEMMQKRNVYFSFARQKGAPITREGILSKATGTNKLERFRYILPMFQNKKIYFPDQLKETTEMKEALKQLKGATHSGFTTHDDFNDGISQLGLIDIIPGNGVEELSNALTEASSSIWGSFDDPEEHSNGSTVF